MVKPTYPNEAEPLLRVDSLVTKIETEHGTLVALDQVSLTIGHKEVVGLVGESGSGKSMTALSIMQLLPKPSVKIVSGRIYLGELEITSINEEEMRKVRGGRIAMIFQDPATFLNPIMRVGDQIAEVIGMHQKVSQSNLNSKVVEALELVRMPDAERTMRSFPHQLSGGMRQRVMIAMAISSRPSLLIADECTTALDVTIQNQIIDLLIGVVKELNMSLLFITHDLSLIAQTCDRVYVMYAGEIVEEAPVDTFFERPSHPYSAALIESIPTIYDRKERFSTIPGNVPNLINPPSGCRFHPRCSYVMDICKNSVPHDFFLGSSQMAKCWLHGNEINNE